MPCFSRFEALLAGSGGEPLQPATDRRIHRTPGRRKLHGAQRQERQRPARVKAAWRSPAPRKAITASRSRSPPIGSARSPVTSPSFTVPSQPLCSQPDQRHESTPQRYSQWCCPRDFPFDCPCRDGLFAAFRTSSKVHCQAHSRVTGTGRKSRVRSETVAGNGSSGSTPFGVRDRAAAVHRGMSGAPLAVCRMPM
jgi:hypothetical protein